MEHTTPKLDQGNHTENFEESVPVSSSSPSTRRVSAADVQDSDHRYPLEAIRNNGRYPRHIPIVAAGGYISPWDTSHNGASQLSLGSTLPGDYRNSLAASTIFESRQSQSRASWGAHSQAPLNGRTRSSTLKEDMLWNIPKPTLSIMDKGISSPSSEKSHPSPTFGYNQKEGSTSTVADQGPSLIPIEIPNPRISGLREILLIAVLCSGQFLSLASLASTVAPQNIIGEGLHADSPGTLVWFTASYSMTLGTFILPAGRLGDIFGQKKLFLLGWVWMTVFSFIAGFCRTPIPFSIARALQGMGPAFLVPNGIAIIARTWPMGDKRSFVISLNGACGPTGFVTGALFSSIIAQYTSWPWAFWATGFACTIISFLAYIIVPESMAQPATPQGASPPRFDYLGCVTGVVGLILINFALNQAPLVGWGTPYIYLLFISGVITTAFFIYAEFKLTDNPLVPVRELQPQALLTLGCVAAGWASHGIWLYYFFNFLMNIRKQSPLLATAELAPVVPVGIAFALSTKFLMKKMHVSKIMLLAMLFFCIGIILLCVASLTHWGLIFLSVLITPGGMNLSFPAATILLSNSMPKEHQGKAASLVATIVNYSLASGLGIAGSVERAVSHDGSMLLKGYQSSWYVGIGFATLGVFISLYFVWQSRRPALAT